MEEKMISILIPTHKSGAWLQETVESALSGTKRCKTEILLIDDGTDEDTAAVCRNLMREHEEVIVHKMQDRGVSAARNLAMDKARGEYLCFLDADDRILKGGLDVLLDIMQETNADIAGGAFVFGTAYAECPAEEVVRAEKKTECQNGEQFVRDGILQKDTHVWGKLFKTETAKKCRFIEGMTIGEDMLYLLDLTGEKEDLVVARTKTPVWFYFINPQGAMEKPYTKSYYDQIRCWEKAEKKIHQYHPAVLKNESAATLFKRIRLVTAMLVPGKIIRLPKQKQEEFREDYENARACIRTLYNDEKVKKALAPQERVKTILLLHFQGLYKRVFGV